MATLVRWNPVVREMATMQRLMDRMMDDTLRAVRPIDNPTAPLALDIHEDEATYTIVTTVPGASAENINVNLHEDVLTIEAELPKRVANHENSRALLQERTSGKFSRRVRLPLPVNTDTVEAVLENGVLTLTLPKVEQVQPRTIPVRTQAQITETVSQN